MGMRLGLVFERVQPTRGGAETYVADLCRLLVARGHSVDLFANAWEASAIASGVNCHHIEATGRTRTGRIWSFAQNAEAALAGHRFDCTIGLINTWSQDVLIPQGGVHPASLEYNARRFRPGWKRALYLAGKRLNPRYQAYRSIERMQYDPARAGRYVAVSQMVKGHLEHFYQVPPDRIAVIPNAIDAARMDVPNPQEVRARFRATHGYNHNDLVALFLAHNFKLKGLGPLLQAMAQRKLEHPGGKTVHLAVCGGGKPAPFRKLVTRLGLEQEVRFLGFLPEASAAFHGSDFFVLPSYYDPCSLVVFEALACGLPVITTACNGAGELIHDAREGFVVSSPDDTAGLARALQRMTEDAARSFWSEAAQRLGREQSFDRHLSRLIDLFEQVAREKQRRSRIQVRADRGTPLIGADRAGTAEPPTAPPSKEPRPRPMDGETNA